MSLITVIHNNNIQYPVSFYHLVVEPAATAAVEVVWRCVGRLWDVIKHKYKEV